MGRHWCRSRTRDRAWRGNGRGRHTARDHDFLPEAEGIGIDEAVEWVGDNVFHVYLVAPGDVTERVACSDLVQCARRRRNAQSCARYEVVGVVDVIGPRYRRRGDIELGGYPGEGVASFDRVVNDGAVGGGKPCWRGGRGLGIGIWSQGWGLRLGLVWWLCLRLG